MNINIESNDRNDSEISETESEFNVNSVSPKEDYINKLIDKQMLSSGSNQLLENPKQLKTDKWFYCSEDDCDFKTKLNIALNKHKKSIHSNGLNEVSISYTIDENINKLKYNELNDKKDSDLIEISSNCEESDEELDVRQQTKNHLKRHQLSHIGIQFKCDFENCSKSFLLKSRLKRHLNSVHNMSGEEYNSKYNYKNKTKRFRCDWKGLFGTYQTSDGLNKHKNIHLNKYCCHFKGCDFKGCTKYQLKRHLISTQSLNNSNAK